MKKILTLVSARNPYDTHLFTLYVLNVTDYIFTLILLSSGLFIEANPVMNTPINTPWGFVLKCIVPLMLVTYLHIRFCMSEPRHPRATRILLNIILVYYMIINTFHIFWLIYLIIALSR